jgi:hypothetical protein
MQFVVFLRKLISLSLSDTRTNHYVVRLSFVAAIIVSSVFTVNFGVPAPRPEFVQQMYEMRPVILEAAARHNPANLSRMSDNDFAVVVALILYNEDLGSVEERVGFLRATTTVRKSLEVYVNELIGSNLSIRPSNVRPSVAHEMLRHQLPIPGTSTMITIPITVTETDISDTLHVSQPDLYRAITHELVQPDKAIEYLTANLERGIYRARYENVPVSWQTLMAWHIRGLVSPGAIRRNPDAYAYTKRLTYLKYACELIYGPNIRKSQICRSHNRIG